VLEELNVDRDKVVVVLTKYDNSTDAHKIDEIIKELRLENPLVVSSKTGYGIHRLKTIIKQHSMPRK
jgi:GTP-binding protein HflX